MNDEQRLEIIAIVEQARADEADRYLRKGRRIFYGYIIFLCCLAVAVVCGL